MNDLMKTTYPKISVALRKKKKRKSDHKDTLNA